MAMAKTFLSAAVALLAMAASAQAGELSATATLKADKPGAPSSR